jgi:hypothetical protein
MNMQSSQSEPLFTKKTEKKTSYEKSFFHKCFLFSLFLFVSTIKIEIQAVLPTAIFEVPKPMKEVVLLHTSEGFVPKTLVLDTDHHFQLVVVNVNPKTKTASFFIDEFGIQQGMSFSEPKKVILRPKQVGHFFVLSPESGFESQLVVISSQRK